MSTAGPSRVAPSVALRHWTLQLKNGAEAISFRDLVEFNGTNLDRLNDWMTAFSAIDYGRPELSWSEPADGESLD